MNIASPTRRVGCPAADRVLSLQNGRLPAGEVSLLEDHVAECPHCGELLDAFDSESDDLFDALATLPISPDDEVEYQRLHQSLLTATWTDHAVASMDLRLADPPTGPLPQPLGNYELVSCIGRGAWGAVYRARHRTLDQTVAVKVLDSERWSNPAYLEHFIQEAKAAGQLNHPNMVRATDAGEDRGLHYLVMEFIDGADAARVLRETGRLEVAEACEIVRQAAVALDFAHRRGWVHRDVKPSNLLIAREGDVKLLDLGIAGRRSAAHELLEPAHPPMGTVDYMAPEQWTDFASVDARADVYSLGCTLFKLLTGRAPFIGGGRPSRNASSERPAPSIATYRPNVGRRLDRFVQRMLAHRPEDRVSAAADVASALAPWARRSDLSALVTRVCGPAPSRKLSGEQAVADDRLTTGSAGRGITRRGLLIGGGLAAGAAAVATPWWFLRRNAQLRRSAWRPLAPTSPAILLAAEPSDQIRLETLAGGEISVQSSDLVLVHLGRAVSGVFAMRVNLQQESWHAGAGVFFRYHWTDDPLVCAFQSVELRPDEDAASPTGGRLLWSRCTAELKEDKLIVERDPWAETPVDFAGGDGGQSLEVVLGHTGFPEVRFNGRVLAQAAWQLSVEGRRQASTPPESVGRQYLGRLGLVSLGGKTVFLSPQLAYL